MNLYRTLKIAFFFAGAILVLLIAATMIFLKVEPLQRYTFTTVLSMASELDVQIGEITDLQLFPSPGIVVRDLNIVSSGLTPVGLLSVERFGLKLDAESIFSSNPWLITDLEVHSARVNLSHLKSFEADDWYPGISEMETKFEIPVEIDHWQFTDSQIVYRDDDQDIVLNVGLFEGEAFLEEIEISLVGDLNGLPITVMGSGEAVKSRAEGSLQWGNLSASLSTNPKLTASMPIQQFNIYATAPSSKLLLDLLGAPELRDGKFSLQVNVDRSTVNTDIVVDVDLGEFRIDLSSRVDDMTRLNEIDFSYQVEGPSLEEAGALFDFLDFPSLPFSIRGSVNRQNTHVDINRSVLNIGDGEFIVQGSLPNFPSIDGWQLDLEGDEFGLDMLRPFTGKCDLPRDSYRWFGSFRTNEAGEESMNLLLENAQRRLHIEGTIGPGPEYEGTILNLDSEGIHLSRFGGCLSMEGLTDEPTQISAVLTKKGQEWILSPFTVVTDSMTVNLTLAMDQLPGPDAVHLEINLVTDDLGKIFDPSGATWAQAVSESSLSVEATIEGTTSDLQLTRSHFLFNDQPGTITGRLGDLSTRQQLKLLFEYTGEDIWQPYRGDGASKLPFRLSGNMDSVPQGWRFSDVLLKAGSADLTGNGLLSNHKTFVGSFLELNMTGNRLSELVPPALTKGSLEQPINLEVFARYEEKGIDVSKLNISLGASKLDASGFIDLPPDYRETRGQLSIEGSSSAEFLALFGYESEFLDRAFTMTAQFGGTSSQMSVEQINLIFGESDLTGRASVDWLDLPYIDFDLRSTYLYLPYFFPRLETINEDTSTLSSGDMTQYEDDLTEEELSERLIEDSNLSTGWMNRLEGEFTLNAEEVFFSVNTSMAIDVDLNMKEGTLTSRQFSWYGPSFKGHADLEIDQQEVGARYLLDIHSTRLPLFSLFSGDSDTDGEASYRARVTSSGDSIISLLGNMDGKLLFKGSGGTLHTNQLDAFFGDFFSHLTSRLLGQKRKFVKVQCTAGAMDIRHGELHLNPGFVLRTDRVDIFTRGKIDLAEESLELSLNTRSRRGIGISAMKTVSPRSRVAGTFANPRYIFDATGAVASGTAAVVTGGLTVVASGLRDRLLARRNNPCSVVYEQAIGDKKLGYADLVAP